MHCSQVDPDQTHETVSYWDECAEQLPQARLGQHKEMEPDEDADENEQTVTTWEPTLNSEPSDSNGEPLGPRQHKSPDPLGALEASLSQHASVPAPEASAHKLQVFPKEQSGKAFRIPRSDEPQVQQRGSQDTRTSLNSSPLFVQHSHKYKERNSRDPHARRLRIWKEVSDKHRGLRELEKRAETATERQKLSPKKKGSKKRDRAAESALKGGLIPSKHPHQSKQNQKDQQPNQQGHPQSPNLHDNRQQRFPNAPSPSDNPHLQHPIHNPPPHSKTTPPPVPTPMPSPIAQASKQIYHHHPPPHPQPDPPTAPTTYPSSKNAAPHCRGCNVNLAEIERTTPFRYPKACPLCHTPRIYLNSPTKPTKERAMAQANPVPDAHNPAPNLFKDHNSDAVFIKNKPACMQPEDRHSAILNQNKRYSPADVHTEIDPRPEAKRAKVLGERNVYEGEEAGYLRSENGIIEIEMYDDDDGTDENESEADDEATVDEEESEGGWVEGGWEGTYEEDVEVAIKSEDEV